ncbi:MAG: diguanylate cyclase [Desulfobulbales bacterium]|nr:diguanylate cyclase [Desulfobulbales bacterium]
MGFPFPNPRFVHSVRFKLLAGLLLVLALSLGIALYGLLTYERDQFIAIAHQDAMRAGHTIEQALRAAMLHNDPDLTRLSLNNIGTIIEPPSTVSIIANNWHVAYSTDDRLVGTIIDRDRDPSCTVCHVEGQTVPSRNAVMLENEDGPFLRNVVKIVNEPACHACHPPDRVNLGILLLDSSMLHTYELLKTVAFRTLLTGLLTFLVIVVVLSFLVNKFIHRPMAVLQEGFARVGSGDYEHWVTIDSGVEFAEMADSFNIMTKDIDRFVREIKQKNKETATLYTVVQQISKTINLLELNKILIDLLADIFESEDNCLVLPDWTQDDCVEITWRPKNDERLRVIRYCHGSPDFSCPALTTEELKAELRRQSGQPLFLAEQSRVVIPLRNNGRPLGFVVVGKGGDAVFSHSEKAFIPVLTNHLAIAFENARLYHLAITDGLTGLFSKRHFLDTIGSLTIAGAGREDEKFGLLILDLDHFKEVNDTHGHLVGDQILIQLSQRLKDNIRLDDVACRYGGEEFAILLPALKEDTQGTVAEVAERLCRAVGRQIFLCADTPPLHLTISIGAAIFPRDGVTPDDLIRAADGMLYEAKRLGRNQVRICA